MLLETLYNFDFLWWVHYWLEVSKLQGYNDAPSRVDQVVALHQLKGVALHVPWRGAAENFRCVPSEPTFGVVSTPLRYLPWLRIKSPKDF